MSDGEAPPPPRSAVGNTSAVEVPRAGATQAIASAPSNPSTVALPVGQSMATVVAAPTSATNTSMSLPPVNTPAVSPYATGVSNYAQYPPAGVGYSNAMQSSPTNPQYKRSLDEFYMPNVKRTKVDGPITPGSMGPPSTMGPPSATQRNPDQGLDEGDPNDVFGGAGINLQDEERNMAAFDVPRTNHNISAQPYQPQQRHDFSNRARKSDFLHYSAFDYMIKTRLSEFGLSKYDDDTYGLMGLALKERLSGLLGQMIVLAKHRCAPPPKNGTPIDDVGRILRGISMTEAQDEERRRTIAAARRLEEEAKRRQVEDASHPTKKKVGGPKNLTEQAVARNANATAQMMLNQSGAKKYSWMTGAPNTSQISRRSTVQAANGILPNVFKTGSEEHGSLITLKDFIGAVELEGQDTIGRGGKALLKAYTQLKD